MPNFQPQQPLEVTSQGPYRTVRNIKESLQQDLVNLVLTEEGGWPNRPALGIGLKRYLFELDTSPLWSELKQKIVNQVRDYIEGIDILDVGVDFGLQSDTVDQNKAIITIMWQVSRTADRSSVRFTLDSAAEQVQVDLPDTYSPDGAYGNRAFIDGEWVYQSPGDASGRPW